MYSTDLRLVNAHATNTVISATRSHFGIIDGKANLKFHKNFWTRFLKNSLFTSIARTFFNCLGFFTDFVEGTFV